MEGAPIPPIPSLQEEIGRYPGDVCDEDNPCVSTAVCSEGVCNALNPTVGASCKNTYDCAP